MKECLKFANRLTQTHIKNVTFASMGIEPFSGSNDNALISTLNFSASVVTDVEGA